MFTETQVNKLHTVKVIKGGMMTFKTIENTDEKRIEAEVGVVKGTGIDTKREGEVGVEVEAGVKVRVEEEVGIEEDGEGIGVKVGRDPEAITEDTKWRKGRENEKNQKWTKTRKGKNQKTK